MSKHYAEIEIENIIEVNSKDLESKFSRLTLLVNSRISNKGRLMKIKTFIEYFIIFIIIYYIFN